MGLITTTADLISSIDKRSFVPTNQLTFTDPDKLALANEELETHILPRVLNLREEYYVYSTDTSFVGNQAEYDIPHRAIGLIVREIHILDTTSGRLVRDPIRIAPQDIRDYGTEGLPSCFYLKNNKIVLNRTPSSAGYTLRIFYHLRPAKFVETSYAAVISAIDTGTNTVTVSTIPSTWVTGNIFDLARQDGGMEPLAIEQTSTLISGNDITFSSLPSDLRVGDHVSLADETAVLFMIPELRAVLAQFVAARMKKLMKVEDAKDAFEQATAMLAGVLGAVEPRVEGALQYIYSDIWG